LGLSILAAAVALGAMGDMLLRALPWGVNASLSIGALVLAAALLVRRHRVPLGADASWLALTALLLGAAFVRRDSEGLQFFDLVALCGVLALTLLVASGRSLRDRAVMEYVVAAVLAVGHAAIGGLRLVFGDIRWSDVRLGGRMRTAKGVAIGTLLAAPLLIVFGALFASADVIFADVLDGMLAFEPRQIVGHVMLAGFLGYLAAGYFTGMLLRAQPGSGTDLTLVPNITMPSLGIIPAATALGLVNLLFLLFVVVQLRYLFGGQAMVFETTGLTLAEYARGGFFELVTVSGLVLPLLLATDGLLRDADGAARRTFRNLAGLLLVLLGVVMTSALERMRLYVAEFGLSEDRLYATAFMGYLAILFSWFAWTVLRDRRRRFAFGGLVQGLAVLAGLHLLNPDALIARVNVDRARESGRFDAAYLATHLSADAVPVLVERLPSLPRAQACEVAQRLLERWTATERDDWRSWNWSRHQARRLVSQQEPQLRALACDPTGGNESHRDNGPTTRRSS